MAGRIIVRLCYVASTHTLVFAGRGRPILKAQGVGKWIVSTLLSLTTRTGTLLSVRIGVEPMASSAAKPKPLPLSYRTVFGTVTTLVDFPDGTVLWVPLLEK